MLVDASEDASVAAAAAVHGTAPAHILQLRARHDGTAIH